VWVLVHPRDNEGANITQAVLFFLLFWKFATLQDQHCVFLANLHTVTTTKNGGVTNTKGCFYYKKWAQVAIFREWAPSISPLHRQNPKILYFPLLTSPNLAKSSCGRSPTDLLHNLKKKVTCETHKKNKKRSPQRKVLRKGTECNFFFKWQ
jgi:hypothetical protein